MKKNLAIILAATLAVIAANVTAQNVQTPSDATVISGGSDYVTIGSRLPYYVEEDATIRTLVVGGQMKESVFEWKILDNTSTEMPGVPKLEFDGSAGQQYDGYRVAAAGTGLFDNEISVEWNTANGFAVGTQYSISVAEQSVNLSGTVLGCKDDTPTTMDVFVLARPTVAFDGTEGGGCSVSPGSTFYVPLDITGIGDWTIEYTVSYNGGAADPAATYDLTLADPTINDGNVIAESTISREANGTPDSSTDGLAISLPAAQYGYYDIAITDISDAASKKSLDALAKAGATGTYRIYVNPSPNTSPIRHIDN